MARYTYTALVTEHVTYAVHVEVEIPDGRSPWGPKARELADKAARKAAAVAQYVGEQPQTRTTVQLTNSIKEA